MVEIDKGNRHQGSTKKKEQKILGAQLELDEQGCAQQPCDGLHHGILQRNGILTMSAPAQKEDIADEGDIVVEPDTRPALGATGGRMDDRFLEGDTVNAYIEETPNRQPKEKRE